MLLIKCSNSLCFNVNLLAIGRYIHDNLSVILESEYNLVLISDPWRYHLFQFIACHVVCYNPFALSILEYFGAGFVSGDKFIGSKTLGGYNCKSLFTNKVPDIFQSLLACR